MNALLPLGGHPTRRITVRLSFDPRSVWVTLSFTLVVFTCVTTMETNQLFTLLGEDVLFFDAQLFLMVLRGGTRVVL